MRLADNTIWQSSNEGYTWEQKFPGERFLAFYMHTHTNRRAYLITDSSKFYYTSDGGDYWHPQEAPSPPNSFNAAVLRFQPRSDNIIWIGSVGCENDGENCRAQAHYSTDNGRRWSFIEDYVVNCDWARDDELHVDWTQILCESYLTKQGSQHSFGRENALQLISGRDYFEKKNKLFDHVVGFTKFSEFLIVAEVRWLSFGGSLLAGPELIAVWVASICLRRMRWIFRSPLTARHSRRGSSLQACILTRTYV